MHISEIKICVIGLGYVGLPLAVEFSKKFKVTGFDINTNRIDELRNNFDRTLEVSNKDLSSSENLVFTDSINETKSSNFYIVTVPTPLNDLKKPDLKPLKDASEVISKIIKKGDFVVFESTVYPGATEEICIPILEKGSKLALNSDFFVGYSPERINPGDKDKRINQIVKVTSGSNKYSSEVIDNVYSKIIDAGTHMAKSIKVAEAAKVIENTQRDLNIALVNELAIIFDKLGIDSNDVFEAAKTKWNFLPFEPGMVGGHCIGVDPYYLTEKSISIGYTPEVILAGRKINDGMTTFIANRFIDEMMKKNISITDSKILIFGATFKENCPDLRNTKIKDLIDNLLDYGLKVDVYDPWCDEDEFKKELKGNLISEIKKEQTYDGLIFAVKHQQFFEINKDEIENICKDNRVIYDLKHILNNNLSDIAL